MNSKQLATYLENQSEETALDIIAGNIESDCLEHFLNLCDERSSNPEEYAKSCKLFVGAILDRVQKEVERFEDAQEMFSSECGDESAAQEHCQNLDHQSANEINADLKRGCAA